MKYDIMSMSHRRAKALIKAGDKRNYREVLSIALKVMHMKQRPITTDDINYLKSFYLNGMVDLSLIQSLHKENTYLFNFSHTGKIIFAHKNPYYVHGRQIIRSKFN